MGKLPKENYRLHSWIPPPFIKRELIFRHFLNRGGGGVIKKGKFGEIEGRGEAAGFLLVGDWGDPPSTNQKIDLSPHVPNCFAQKLIIPEKSSKKYFASQKRFNFAETNEQVYKFYN